MKKLILLLIIILPISVQLKAQPKKTFKVYYVPFTELQYLALQKQATKADSLLSVSDAKAKDIIPVKDMIDNVFSVFQQAYLRKDTLQLQPLNPSKK